MHNYSVCGSLSGGKTTVVKIEATFERIDGHVVATIGCQTVIAHDIDELKVKISGLVDKELADLF